LNGKNKKVLRVLEPLTQKSFLLDPGPTILSLTDEYSKIVDQVEARKRKLIQGILMEKEKK